MKGFNADPGDLTARVMPQPGLLRVLDMAREALAVLEPAHANA